MLNATSALRPAREAAYDVMDALLDAVWPSMSNAEKQRRKRQKKADEQQGADDIIMPIETDEPGARADLRGRALYQLDLGFAVTDFKISRRRRRSSS